MKIKNLYEWLNESGNGGFLEPTKENLKKFGIRLNKTTINPDGSIDYNGDLNLSEKGLKSIPFRFNKVTGYFDCSYNQLVSLEGCPREVGGDFKCSCNNLINLADSPVKVAGFFDCRWNLLVSLVGAPETISLTLWTSGNIILYNPTKYKGSFELDKKWSIPDSSGNRTSITGEVHLKMAFERLDELSFIEVVGIRSGLEKVTLPDDLRRFCQGKIEKYLEKNISSKIRKEFKELNNDVMDMF